MSWAGRYYGPMAHVTRTLGPLHLEDLEPHRFEDLIRQLAYDFRQWRSLESTGRSGSDDGFDARGWEVDAGADQRADEDEDNASDEAGTRIELGRQWLIQCKREKTINPTKLEKYVRGLPSASGENLYGLIFVGACDFSKRARDAFVIAAREMGYSEAYLWGKGEIEDALFQPKNDHLLFAYFGISLQIRRRSLRASVRAQLAMKRKAKTALSPHDMILVRSAADSRYPYLDPDKTMKRNDRGNWRVFQVSGCMSDGVHLQLNRHLAILNEDETWDYADRMDDGPVSQHQDPWVTDEQKAKEDERHTYRQAVFEKWYELTEDKRAWFNVCLVLPYENIIDIDKEGDEYFEHPHIYADFLSPKMGPFRDYYSQELLTTCQWSRRRGSLDPKKRVQFFPTELPVAVPTVETPADVQTDN